MSRTLQALALLVSLGAVTRAAAQGVPFDSVRSLRCTTITSTNTDWAQGKPVVQVSAVVSMAPMVFDAINRQAGTGRMIGNAGATDVVVISNDAGFHFIEVTNSGNLMVTTVFRARAAGLPPGEFAFVHSRHWSLTVPDDAQSRIAPNEHQGRCAVLQ